MTSVLRSDPAAIDTSLKEALADSLLNIVHARISGGGEFGATIYGARPSSLFASGFLLPMRGTDEGDEVTSPIWISSHGLDFQIASESRGHLRIQPHFAIYVRVLPTEDDLRRDDCKATFRLKSEVARELIREINERLTARWEEVKGAYKRRSEHPEWLRIKEQIRADVYRSRGVPTDLTRVGREEQEEAVDAEDQEGIADEGVVLAGSTGGGSAVSDDHFEPLRIPHKWLRLDLLVPPLLYPLEASSAERAAQVAAHENSMRDCIVDRVREWLNSSEQETGGQLWAFRRDDGVLPSQCRQWSQFLTETRAKSTPPTTPRIEPRWDIAITPDWLDPTRLNVHVALENRSPLPRQHIEETEPSLFQVRLAVQVPAACHRPLRLERVEPSYRYNRFLTYAAMGFNGGVTRRDSDDGDVALETTWAPRYTQPRIVPVAYPGIECGVRRLSEPDAFMTLRPLATFFRTWLEGLPKTVDFAAGLDSADVAAVERERLQFGKDHANWQLEIDSIETGIRILEESRRHWTGRGAPKDEAAVPFEAWLAMNEAMADMLAARFLRDDVEWRLFQLAFILASVPTIATRIDAFKHHFQESRDDAVTLLYFPTGGGKSEAFFGLLAFALFCDRLRGKSLGITAMIRYPLRLLTIQQAQRASRVLAAAEQVRHRHQYPGQPFSIGFWVGSGGSPNQLSARGVSDVPTISESAADAATETRLLKSNAKYAVAARAWNKIPRCPFCGAQTALRRFPNRGGLLAHVCTVLRCFANGSAYQPLPFYICDEDIYALAPSVVLGTVDKLALIGHYPTTIRRVLGMFGAAPWRHRADGRLVVPSPSQLRDGPEARGCDRLQPAYPDGLRLFHDPFPALLIQDEAHLLDESLGTFAGLFESGLDQVFEALSGPLSQCVATTPSGKRRRPKVIAASATVAEPERQMSHLYQRHSPAIQFPHPGPDLYESFYSRPEPCPSSEVPRAQHPNIEIRSRQARTYVGFMTNGRPHTATSVAVLSSFHATISGLFRAFSIGDSSACTRARLQLQRHVSPGLLEPIYRQRLEDATGEALSTLVDLHRVALTYVTNKKGGDQIMAAEAEETRKRHLYEGLPLDQFVTRLITGSVDQGEIQNVVDLAQTRPAPGTKFPSLDSTLRSVIATSAVSHGVDVEEFNSMFFAGMPPDVAEYIQASSRVGRTHVGFCVLIPTPQRRRDRFVVEVFDVYHRFLERMVQPAAIDRWAERAIERALPSFFQTFVCGVTPSAEIIEADAAQKGSVPTRDAIPEILSAYRKDEAAFQAGVVEFVKQITGLSSGFAPEGTPFYVRRIDDRIRRLILRISEPDWQGAPLPTFFRLQTDPMWRPMTSLRDVDEAGAIRLAPRDPQGRAQDAAAVRQVMDLIRHGVADAGDEREDEI